VTTFDGGVSNLKIAPLDEDTKAIAVTGEWWPNLRPSCKPRIITIRLGMLGSYWNSPSSFGPYHNWHQDVQIISKHSEAHRISGVSMLEYDSTIQRTFKFQVSHFEGLFGHRIAFSLHCF
jgi:hypothetical protein